MRKIYSSSFISSFFSVVLFVVCFQTGSSSNSCSKGSYTVESKDGSITCKNCTSLLRCPHGMGVSTYVKCGDVIQDDTEVHCVECVAGKNFSSNYDKKPCQNCHSLSCHPNEAFNGTCDTMSDTTTCKGVCMKGFYPENDSVAACKPCSTCHGSRTKRIQKCIHDKMPRGKQCEFSNIIPPTVSTVHDLEPSTVKKDTEEMNRKNRESNLEDSGYQFYGHPGFLSASLCIIAVLSACLIVVCWKKKCRRKKYPKTLTNPEEIPLSPTNGDQPTHVLGDVGNQTDNFKNTAALTNTRVQAVAPSVRRRSSSAEPGSGMGKRKVSFNRQSSSSESEFKEERRRIPSFGRQNSNPDTGKKEEKGVRRSKTFGSFSSLGKGTAEETTPILSRDTENNNDVIMFNANSLPEHPETGTVGRKVCELNAGVYDMVCRKLNHDIGGKDWKTLAGRMGYKSEQVKNFELESNSADALLSHWGTKSENGVTKLVELLVGMDRGDIVETLESEYI